MILSIESSNHPWKCSVGVSQSIQMLDTYWDYAYVTGLQCYSTEYIGPSFISFIGVGDSSLYPSLSFFLITYLYDWINAFGLPLSTKCQVVRIRNAHRMVRR